MIKEKRKKLGYTQEKLANVLKINVRELQRLEDEEFFPRKNVFALLVLSLELSDEEIVSYVRNVLR